MTWHIRNELDIHDSAGFVVATAVSAEAAARVVGMAGGWRPIESAPKTRRSRLVYCPERQNTYIVSWWDNGHNEPGWVHSGGMGGELCETPSHWMPLPEPPGIDRKRAP